MTQRVEETYVRPEPTTIKLQGNVACRRGKVEPAHEGRVFQRREGGVSLG